MKNHLQQFWLLFLAYTVSIVYQFYRFTLHQYPEYDTFGVTEIIQYAILFCWSGLALIQRKWAVWSIISLCLIQLGVGLFYYIPVIFLKRHDTFWDWAECLVFISLIALAGYKTLLLLRKYKKKTILKVKSNKPQTDGLDTILIGR